MAVAQQDVNLDLILLYRGMVEVIAKLQEAARKAQADAARLEAGGAAELVEEDDDLGDEDAAEAAAEDGAAAGEEGGARKEAAGAGTSGAA